jgi:hypothetical protein
MRKLKVTYLLVIAALFILLNDSLANAAETLICAKDSIWDILTALGTVGAVIVALAISFIDKRRSHKEEQQSGRIVAAKLLRVVNWFCVDIHHLTRRMIGSPDGNRANFDELCDVILRIHFEPSIEELLKLSRVSSSVAGRLAIASGFLATLKTTASSDAKRREYYEKNEIEQQLIRQRLLTLSDLLSDVVKELEPVVEKFIGSEIP